MNNSPDVELDALNAILEGAVAAFPHALRVGKMIIEMHAERIYCIRDKIQQSLGDQLTDSRLSTHYAMLTACSLQVSDSILSKHISFLVLPLTNSKGNHLSLYLCSSLMRPQTNG